MKKAIADKLAGKTGKTGSEPNSPAGKGKQAITKATPDWRLEEGDKPSRALQVVRELHTRYQKQVQRWQDYIKLFTFLGFVALFLAVLFLQRNAQVAYQVHNTISTVIVPGSNVYESSDDVYSWLQGTLTTVWVDPICGDGICETPFEFASYGRFGCRADCGKLAEIQNLTTVQIDLYYDFTHPVGSVPATELMNQASWNLCPTSGAPHGTACYYDTDQQFSLLSGEVHTTVTDMPDGDWTVTMKRDLFNKVAGGVRKQQDLEAYSELVKIGIALNTSDAQRYNEIATLQSVIALAQQSEFQLDANTVIAANNATVAQIQTDFGNQVFNETVYWDKMNATAANLTATLGQLGNTANLCPQVPWYNSSATVDPLYAFTPSDALICGTWLNTTLANDAARFQTIRDSLNGRLTAAQNAGSQFLANAVAALQASSPEVYTFVVADSGQDPQGSPYTAVINQLANFYVEGPYTIPPPARAALTRPNVNNANRTLTDFATLANSRIQELTTERANVAALPEVQAYSSMSQGASTITYDYVTWTGGADAYDTCNLETRSPNYVGTCAPRMACSSATVKINGADNIVYSCAGTSLSASDCSNACDQQATCDALCVCEDANNNGCATTQVCTCSACSNLVPAQQDPSYQTIVSVATSAGTASGSASAGSGKRRQLLQSPSTDSTLNQILTSVNSLQTGQTALQTNIDSLKSEVDAANAAAAARAQDTSLTTLINAGRADIQTGQQQVETLLNQIIGKQNDAAAAAQAAANALAAIQDLQAQQVQAQQAIEAAVRNQLDAIKVASQQGLISLSQALELWKQARRSQLVATKEATLSNIPCTTDSLTLYGFIVNSYNQQVVNTARERRIGLTNRVIAGMLLQTTRTTPVNCSDSRFNNIESECKGHADTAPYGVDPVFKLGATLYNPDLDNEASVTSFYNCSELTFSPTYNIPDPAAPTVRTTNPPPYCAELFNARNLPYGFRSYHLSKLGGDSFPVWFDINLSAADAQNYYEYISDGLLLDSNTRSLTAQFITYNPELQIFGSSVITFQFTDGGSIQVQNNIHTLRVELYEKPGDYVRLTLEILLTIAVCLNLVGELYGIALTQYRQKNALLYFQNGWAWLDFISMVLMMACVCIWWDFAINDARPFDIQLRYNVYDNLEAQAAYLKLSAQGMYLDQVQNSFSALQVLVNKLAWYYALNGINILLLIARVLKRMDFQPRLGVVTRSLALAGPDLIHFVLVCGMVFVGYAMMAHLIFGNAIQKFSSFGRAVDTCFAILLGDISVNDDLKQLSGLQGLAGTLFFWSFELLVFMVLLNFLLAIIVDAFSEVKENTSETTGLHTEVGQMVREKWRSLTAGCLNSNYVPDKRLGQLLRQWGGEDDHEQSNKLAANRENAEKKLKVLGEEMTAEELKEVLQACLRDVPLTTADEEAGSKAAFCFKPKAPNKMASEEELDKAAEYVVARFGIDDEEEAEEGGEEAGGGNITDAVLERERDQLAMALERLADVQRELADGQRNLMTGQRQLAEQQQRLVALINPPSQ
ncbi:hypothetical protein WJX72_003501 [[Myrmecia] bisecta]|uniref:Polycystin cation channel PKD1/PKD2 domain-containing protein n=1 Tax=[Myrmecia] bisecta TaxID=41462 RepID=A0AAW1QEP5_9CHLO